MKDTRGIAAAVALALVVGSGLAVVSVSSAAEAHYRDITVSCEAVHVTGSSYNTKGENYVTIQIDGGKTEKITFEKSFDSSNAMYAKLFTFSDPTVSHTFKATIQGWDGYKKELAGESTPCATPVIASLKATSCEVPGGSTDISATFKGLVADRKYELTLEGGTDGPRTVEYVPTQTTGSYTWTGVDPGASYKVTLTDTTNHKLSACKSVKTLECPAVAGIAIVPTECTVTGEEASLKVNVSNLVAGRTYLIEIVNATSGKIAESHEFQASASVGSYNATEVMTSGSYYATIVDMKQANATPLKSSTHTFLPCPEEIAKPVLTATQCDVVSSEGEGEIAVAVESLVPGRTYNIVVSSPSGTPVLSENDYVATSDRFEITLTDLPAGEYTASVTDAAVSEYTNSAVVTLLPCATNDTTVALTADECTIPGGDTSLTATVSDYAVGRDYTVAVMLDNVVVGEPRALDSSTGTAQQFTFDGLEAGHTYRVIVTDTASNPTVTAAADMFLAACPEAPAVLGSQVECSVDGESGIEVVAGNLFAGETYTVTVVVKSTGESVPGVEPVVFVADMPTRTVTIENLPTAETYTVTVESDSMELVSTSELTLEVCDLPTLPLPPEEPTTTTPSSVELPTLAYTGSSTIAPTLAGLGFLQLGLVLVGFSVARRRSVVRGS
ncbi:RTX toxin [Salinibacterium sp. NK8237]|uniref:RTX toxin n=1 Tax=Salinibacterium sp. NK8237 TaxID=2792038 RepID=UPI001E4860FC|nr:RTX toxin [Salinibacterium sp. NK8237]